MGDTAGILRSACRSLAGMLSDLKVSSFYRTDPRDFFEQPPFLNAAVRGLTDLEPAELLKALQSVEAAHGRDRSRELSKGPRTLDIDLLLYGDKVLDLPGLSIPHPRLSERLFALVPLLELSPDIRDPRTGRPFRRIAARLPPQGIYLQAPAGL